MTVCVLGVDQSYTGFGYATGEGTFLKRFPLSKFEHDIHRLVEIRKWWRTIVRNYPADLMVIEGYAHAAKHGREQAGELGGVVKSEAYDAGIPVLVVPPTSLKKYVTGSGNAKKNVMLQQVYKRWNEEFTDDNKADAFALRQLGMQYMFPNQWPDLIAAQRGVLEKLSKESPAHFPVS